MPLVEGSSIIQSFNSPSWAAGLLLSLFHRMNDNSMTDEDIRLYLLSHIPYI